MKMAAVFLVNGLLLEPIVIKWFYRLIKGSIGQINTLTQNNVFIFSIPPLSILFSEWLPEDTQMI